MASIGAVCGYSRYYAMSRPTEANVEDERDFKWGNKRGDGVKNKYVQFYESFTYKRVEYFL
ncbi:Protein ANTI-SILENCING 1 [Senna tora]|uniref:Protein ANTI-SILENCING 1 n=1 Tax=Senna tora TaxID=362788 RepID=A0A835CH30_9FABA|nr:Protein ANTI-SILENCING 1 [Senna tora]